jgi:hypothetical protein
MGSVLRHPIRGARIASASPKLAPALHCTVGTARAALRDQACGLAAVWMLRDAHRQASLATLRAVSVSVVLTWQPSAGATYYDVYRDGVKVASAISAPTWTDTSVSPGSTYTYDVDAGNASGTSPASAPISVTIGLAGPHGIYVFASAAGAAATLAAIAGGSFTNIQGGDWLIGWDIIETSPGVYAWDALDAAIAAASAAKLGSQICFLPGFAAPAWLKAEVPQVPVTLGTGATTICVPTNSVFLSRLQSIIAALGARYASNPGIVSVQSSGLGGQGEMILKAPSNGQSWASYGVDTATLRPAWEAVMGWWVAAFPGKPINLAIDECIFGNSDGDVKSDVLAPLIAYCQAQFGSTVVLQQNGLSAETPESGYWSQLKAASAYTTVGWQMYGSGSSAADLESAFAIGLAANARYFQVYAADIEASANAAALTGLATALGV